MASTKRIVDNGGNERSVLTRGKSEIWHFTRVIVSKIREGGGKGKRREGKGKRKGKGNG